MATNLVVRTDLSGTSFVIDVTALELSSSLSNLDFEVTHNGIVNLSYAKTSQTQLTYTGTSVTLGTRIVARRLTSVSQAETTFISTTTASALTNALEKLRLRVDELDSRLGYTLNQLTQGGISLGTIPISSTAFGAAWNGDTVNAPSRAAMYNKETSQDSIIASKADSSATTASLALKADLASPLFTGDARAATPSIADNDTSLATTAFVKGSFRRFSLSPANVNITGNNTVITAATLTCALGTDTYRFALVRAGFTYSGAGKSVGNVTGRLRDNASTVLDLRITGVNATAGSDFSGQTLVAIAQDTFTGNYSFNLAVVIGSTVTTDVYTMQNIYIEALFIA